MPKGESTAAMVEVDFSGDPRMSNLTIGQRWCYVCWWLQAVKVRAEFLHFAWGSPSAVSRQHFLDHRMATKALQECSKSGLLQVFELDVDGATEIIVRVCGVRSKHSYLKNWHIKEDKKYWGQLRGKSPLSWGEIGAKCGVRDVTGRVGTYRDGTGRSRNGTGGAPPGKGATQKPRLTDQDIDDAYDTSGLEEPARATA